MKLYSYSSQVLLMVVLYTYVGGTEPNAVTITAGNVLRDVILQSRSDLQVL